MLCHPVDWKEKFYLPFVYKLRNRLSLDLQVQTKLVTVT